MSVSAALRGTDACVVLPEEPSDRERYLSSHPSLNPFSAARLAAIDCPLQELLALGACDQVKPLASLSCTALLFLALMPKLCTAHSSRILCQPCLLGAMQPVGLP